MMRKVFMTLAVLLVAGATVVTAAVKLDDVKCVVADRAAKEANSADYRDAKVFFCCGNCAGKFAEDSTKFAVKANHQLVATKQYEQKACPFSGGDVNPDTAVEFAGVSVGFCCDNCKGKVESSKDEAAKVKMVFDNKAFEKGFQKKPSDES